MVINLNPATASDYNASGNGSGDGVGVGVNPGNGGVAVNQSANVIGGTGSGSGGGGTGTVNLNGNTNDNSGVGNGNGSGGIGTNIMGIITHAIFNGIIYLHVIYAGEDYSKWIPLEEAMAFCPSGVVAYTTLQISEVYDVPMELLLD
ncbi:uncharacterized protein [Drosophila kikkawai]|uniref:Uncharacterized protein n=1 Tax=Drosophila kikkawai TaxID=30033 RepID=A0A6P4J808_DROKI|nr:cell wall protein IFF6 [Drosophila kikkawai]KAH8338162.1 hypothetical protein KR059_010596 [Drosophila kikkawai]